MSKRYLDLFVLLFAIDILLITINRITISSYEPDPFFYIKNLPYYYYIGLFSVLAITIYNIFNTEAKKYINIASICTLCFYLGGIKNFVATGYSHFDIYGVISIINKVINAGYLIKTNTIYPSEYPVSIAFFSIFKLIGGFSNEQLVIYYQSFLSILVPIFILLLSNSICKTNFNSYRKFMFIPPFIISISLANVLAPLSYAIILYEIFLYFYIEQLKSKSTRNVIILIILSIIIILTNPTTAYILVAGFLIQALVSINELKIKLSSFFVLYFSLLLSQTVYRSTTTTNTIANTIINTLAHDVSSTTERITIISPNIYYIFEYRLYILKVILIVLLAIISFISIITKMNKSNYKSSTIEFFIASSLIGFVGLFVISFIALPQFIERPLPFITLILCISLPYMVSNVESIKKIYKKMVFMTLIFLILISVLNNGWSDSYNLITPSEIDGREFLIQHNELKISNEWAPKNVYLKRISNFEILKNEHVTGYLQNVDSKNSIYHNGNFIIYC